MKTLIRATKAIDQESMAGYGAVQYVPLENHQVWTGNGVAADTALNIITIYQCVRVLAETYASLPLIVYRRLPGGGKERASEHPLYETLHSSPNPDMTSFVWRELMMAHLATWGNAYNEIVFDAVGRMQLWPIRPDRIEVKWGADGRKAYTYLNPTGGKQPLDPARVFHIPGMSSDGLVGFSPITIMRKAIRLYQSAEQFGTSLFDNNARPATVLSHPKTLSTGAVTRLAGQMEELRGARNAGKTVVLEEGLTVTEVGIPPEDAQFMQTRTFQKREIAAAYRIQLHKVGDYEHATFSNIEELNQDFIQDTMLPWFVRTEQECNVQLIADPDYFAEFLVDGYLRGNAKARAEANAIRWQHGTLNADDWRAMENENPLPDGLGKTYYVPVNYQSVEDATSGQVVDPNAPPQLVAVKSADGLRCAGTRKDGGVCNNWLLKVAPNGTEGRCDRCKTPFTVKSAGEIAEPKPDPMVAAIVALASREQHAPQMNFAAGAFQSDVHVPPIAEGAVTVNVAPPPAVVNVPKQAAPVVNVNLPPSTPTRKRVEFADGRSATITEESA